jgi:hypothetical protein
LSQGCCRSLMRLPDGRYSTNGHPNKASLNQLTTHYRNVSRLPPLLLEGFNFI